MDNNKTVILVILVAALVVATAVDVMSQSAGQGFLHVILIIVAGATGWYAASNRSIARETSERSIIDELTGLHTYNYFIDRLNEEKKRADRFGSRVSMVLIEIDDFKALSDELGHSRGKEIIKEIGEIVKIQVRGVDIVSRYNTEQFGVLLPNTGRMASHEVAERVRLAVAEGSLGNGKATISAGLATYPDNAGDDIQLIERVEEALGDAQSIGDNIRIWDDTGEQRAAT